MQRIEAARATFGWHSPSEIHPAKNLSHTETLVLFAIYFGPKTSPDTLIRVDQPVPAHDCPQ